MNKIYWSLAIGLVFVAISSLIFTSNALSETKFQTYDGESQVSMDFFFELDDAGDREMLIFIHYAVMMLNSEFEKEDIELPGYFDVRIVFQDDGTKLLKWYDSDSMLIASASLVEDKIVKITFRADLVIIAELKEDKTVSVTSNNFQLTYKITPNDNMYLELHDGTTMITKLFQENLVEIHFDNKYDVQNSSFSSLDDFQKKITTSLFNGVSTTSLWDGNQIMIFPDGNTVVKDQYNVETILSENIPFLLSDGMTITNREDKIEITSEYGLIHLYRNDISTVGLESFIVLSDGTKVAIENNNLVDFDINPMAFSFTTDDGTNVIKSLSGTITNNSENTNAILTEGSIITTFSDGHKTIERFSIGKVKQITTVNDDNISVSHIFTSPNDIHMFDNTYNIKTSITNDGKINSVLNDGSMFQSYDVSINTGTIDNVIFAKNLISEEAPNNYDGTVSIEDATFINLEDSGSIEGIDLRTNADGSYSITCDDRCVDNNWVMAWKLMQLDSFEDIEHDRDPSTKAGGLDPLVFGGWDYTENTATKCNTEHKFDYDNDGFVENFCYEIIGSIFVIDFNNNGNIDNGAEMLNFYRTPLEGHTPITFMQEYENICEQYDCYLWHDSIKNWTVDEYELIPFSFDVDYVRYFPEGKQLVDNGKYAYCAGESVNGEKFYCLQPTYWQKGVLAE